MPAVAKYEPVHVQLLGLAVLARQRGLTFEEFWREACRPATCFHCMRGTLLPKCPHCERRINRPPTITTVDPAPDTAIRFPTDTADKRASIGALEDTKDGWHRAYEGIEPTRREQALILLSPILDEIERQRTGAEPARGNEPEAAVA